MIKLLWQLLLQYGQIPLRLLAGCDLAPLAASAAIWPLILSISLEIIKTTGSFKDVAMVGKISTRVEIRVPIRRLWSALIDPNILQKALPQLVKSIEVLEGNGFSAGTTRRVKCCPPFPHLIEKIEAVDHASYKLITSVVEGGAIGKEFIYTKAAVKLLPGRGDSSTLLNWEFEYEPIVGAVPPLEKAKDGAVRTFKAIEAYVLSNSSLYI